MLLNQAVKQTFVNTTMVLSFMLLPLTAHAQGEGGQMSAICEFTSGPRAGTRHDYAPMQPLLVGTPCHDGRGSTGKVVAAEPHESSQLSAICEFTSGPRAGTRHDYAPMQPLLVGTPCHDGRGSTGKVVAAEPHESSQLSAICEFTSGPRAGTRHDYAPMQPLLVGTPCHDGRGSTGKVVPRR